jgi:hypothetical protein
MIEVDTRPRAATPAAARLPRDRWKSWRNVVEAVRIVIVTLRLAWVSFAVTLIGGLLFVLPQQSHDVIRATLIDLENWQPEQALHCLAFVLGLGLWALSAQIWARIMTMHPRAPRKFPPRCDTEAAADCVDAMPRLLGFSVFVSMAMGVGCILLETPFFAYALVGAAIPAGAPDPAHRLEVAASRNAVAVQKDSWSRRDRPPRSSDLHRLLGELARDHPGHPRRCSLAVDAGRFLPEAAPAATAGTWSAEAYDRRALHNHQS